MAGRVALALLSVLGLVAIGVATWSLVHGGIGWDSRYDTQATLEARSVDPSWTLQRAYASVKGTSEFYGVFLQQFADLLHRVATGSTTLLQPDDPVTYTYQGIANLILAIASVTAFALALALALRSWLAAAFAWSLTLATPLWLGLSHVDFKDIPVAAGLTLISAGLIFSFSIRSPQLAAAVGAVVAGSGGAITLSTRAGSLLQLMALAVGGALLIRMIGRSSGFAIVPTIVAASTAIIAAFAFTWATNPIARISMLQWLQDSTAVARSFPWIGTIRTAGRNVQSTDIPLWYVPAWLGAQLPLLTIAAVVGGAAVLIGVAVRRHPSANVRTALVLVPITLQALFLPLAIIISGAVLYDGIRHLLFALPPLLAIPAVALAALERQAAGRRLLRTAIPLTAVVVVAASLLASISWAPYAYAYLNPIAGANKNSLSWELDYWGVSAREGVERLRKLGYVPVSVTPAEGVGVPWGAIPGTPRPGSTEGLYVFLRGNVAIPKRRAADFGCTVVFTIKRGGHVLGEGARCPVRSAAAASAP